MDPRTALLYKESLRALTQQQAVLDNLRTRTGILLSAAAISSSFLGAQALADSDPTVWSWCAIGSFAVLGLLLVAVLLPRGDWYFSQNVDQLESVFGKRETNGRASLETIQHDLAHANQDAWSYNAYKINKLFMQFNLAAGFLVLEIAFWLVDLAS